MDIREFYKSNQQTNNQSRNDFNDNINLNTSDKYYKNSAQNFSEYQDTINKYKDLSQQDLYKELFTQASELKSQGKLDQNMLNTLSNTLGPMLNDEQRELLNRLIERIK
ncbi:MAG: hypothetical protein ACLRFE_01055 [Clostridia bacterium]